MHVKEFKLTSNTAKICNHALTNSQICLRGDKTKRDFNDVYSPSSKHTQVYLFPTEGSVPLTKELLKEIQKPIELVVPDATWSQAIKFHRREPVLKEMLQVHLINQEPSIYNLRTQIHENGVCTLEAVAYALDIIENTETKDHLLNILKIMNNRNLKARQQIK